MKRVCIGWLALLLCLFIASISNVAAADEIVPVNFSFDGVKYVAELPADYLVYTTKMGKDSSLLAMTGATTKEMDAYMKALGCVLCGVHQSAQHQLWITVKDRSNVFKNDSGELPLNEQRIYYDGVALSRGKYEEFESKGITYFAFPDNPSITTGGYSYYIAFFVNQYEIAVRWESGNGKKTSHDIMQVRSIAKSILTEKQYEIVQTTGTLKSRALS